MHVHACVDHWPCSVALCIFMHGVDQGPCSVALCMFTHVLTKGPIGLLYVCSRMC